MTHSSQIKDLRDEVFGNGKPGLRQLIRDKHDELGNDIQTVKTDLTQMRAEISVSMKWLKAIALLILPVAGWFTLQFLQLLGIA